MKKTLFGTSAIVALSLAAGSASANDWDVTLVGSVTSGMAFASYDNFARNNAPDKNGGLTTHSARTGNDADFALINDGELAFKASITLDNGLSVGAKTEMDLWGGGDATGNNFVDESMIFLSGAFGRIELGEEDGAHDQMHNVGAGAGCTAFSCAYDGGGVIFDRMSIPGDFGIDGGDTGDSLKLTYYTPTISGFKAGASYIPRRGEENVNVTTDDDDFGAYELGVSYANKVGALSYGLGAGFTDNFENAAGANDTESWALSAKIGYAGFSFGGVYEDEAGNANDTGFGVGAGYATGPWNFGVSYVAGNEGDSQGVGLGWDYALGTGVTVGGSIDYGTNEVGGGAPDQEGYGASLLMALSF